MATEIKIKTQIDSTKAETQLLSLANKMETTTSKINKLQESMRGLLEKGLSPDAYIEFENLDYQIKKDQEDLDLLLQKMQEMRGKGKMGIVGFFKMNAEVRELSRSISEAKNKQDELLGAVERSGLGEEYEKVNLELQKESNNLDLLKKKYNSIAEASNVATEKTNNFSSSVVKSSNKGKNALESFAKRIIGLAKRVFIFSLITKAFRSMVAGIQEGFKNLAQYSDEYNQKISAFKSVNAELKNNLASAFSPIMSVIIPALTTLVGWLNTAVTVMAQFFAVLSGKNTFSKAKEQAIDYRKSLDKVGASAKKAKGELASFDDLNILNKNDSGGAGAGGGELVGKDAFETVEVESKIANFAEKVKAIINDLKNAFKEWWSGLDFAPLLASFDRLKKSIEPFIGYIGKGLGWFFENVLKPIGAFVIQDALPAVLNAMADAFNFINTVLTVLSPTFKYFWENILKPLGEYIGQTFIWLINTLGYAFSAMSDLFQIKGESINRILQAIMSVFVTVFTTAKKYIELLKSQVKMLIDYIIQLIGHLIDALDGVITFLQGIFTNNMKLVVEGLIKIWKGLVNAFLDILEATINSVIKMLNTIHVDIPDWVPVLGGKHFGINIPPLNIPRLANGGITTGATLAQIGEAGREAVLPLENNTGWMSDLAEQIASRMPSYGGGNVNLQIDGKTFARLELPYIDGERARIGTTLARA